MENKFVYLLIEPPSGQRTQLIQVHYRSSLDWDADVFEEQSSGDFEATRSHGGDGSRFTLDRRYMSVTHAIALPKPVNPTTAVNILRGRSASDSALQASRDLFLLVSTVHPRRREAERAGTADSYDGPDLRVVIFDPARIVSLSSSAIRTHCYLVRLVNARHQFTDMNDDTKMKRYKGLLSCIVYHMVQSDSKFNNDVNSSVLNSEYNRYANYGHRIALLFDNLYNFLKHPIMERIKEELMVYRESNVSVDGHVWLAILKDLLPIASQHELMTRYFDQDSQNPATESAFSTYFRMALNTGQARETNAVRNWNRVIGQEDRIKLVENIANVRAYQLVAEYTGGSSMTHADFEAQLTQAHTNLNAFNSRAGRATLRAQDITRLRKVFTWANRIGNLKGIVTGEYTASTFTAVLGSLEDLATHTGYKNLAYMANGVKNMVDVYTHSSGLATALQIEDYDAAFGRGLALGAGIVELGYLVATGTVLTGPVGALVTIVGAIGAVIIANGTDSKNETFVRFSMFGSNPHGSTSTQPWSTVPFNHYTNTLPGVKRQLDSLLNILYNYTVHYKYDQHTHVIAVQIKTKFFTETSKFRFKIRLSHPGGVTDTYGDVYFNFRTGARSSRTRTVRVRTTGTSVISRVRARVHTVTGSNPTHIISINFGGVSPNVTGGTGWVQCMPFGHEEFIVPKGSYSSGVVPYTASVPNAFWLQDIAQPRASFRNLDFEPGNFMIMQ